MSKYQFSQAERYIVYLADGGKCFWCGIPVFYSDVQVDHVFPEDLLDHPAELQRVKVEYGLGDNFNLNGFENWVTCHQGCNLRKRNTLLHNAPRTLMMASMLMARAPKLAMESRKFAERKYAERILGMLASGLTAGSISRADVLELVEDPPRISIVSATPAVTIHISKDIELIVPNSPTASVASLGWKIHWVSGNIAYVNDGRVGGMIPNVANPHPSWLCSRCGCYGPWDGIICRNCGNREEPDC